MSVLLSFLFTSSTSIAPTVDGFGSSPSGSGYGGGGGYGQERGGGGGGYGRGGGRGGGGGSWQYTRDTMSDNSNVDESTVTDLIKQRSDAKRNRDYGTADSIRDTLMADHQVGIDDREKT